MARRREDLEASEVFGTVVRMVEEITADRDVGPIASDTSLAGLGLESITLVYLVAELQQKYGVQDLLVDLTGSGTPIHEILVGHLVELTLMKRSAAARTPDGAPTRPASQRIRDETESPRLETGDAQ